MSALTMRLPDGNAVLVSDITSVELDTGSLPAVVRVGGLEVKYYDYDEAIAGRERIIADWQRALEPGSELTGATVCRVMARARIDDERAGCWSETRKIYNDNDYADKVEVRLAALYMRRCLSAAYWLNYAKPPSPLVALKAAALDVYGVESARAFEVEIKPHLRHVHVEVASDGSRPRDELEHEVRVRAECPAGVVLVLRVEVKP